MARTTISLEEETRDRLKALGQKGETYDELVNRLIDHWEESEEDDEPEIEFDPVE
jgi:transcriptional regulator